MTGYENLAPRQYGAADGFAWSWGNTISATSLRLFFTRRLLLITTTEPDLVEAKPRQLHSERNHGSIVVSKI